MHECLSAVPLTMVVVLVAASATPAPLHSASSPFPPAQLQIVSIMNYNGTRAPEVVARSWQSFCLHQAAVDSHQEAATATTRTPPRLVPRATLCWLPQFYN